MKKIFNLEEDFVRRQCEPREKVKSDFNEKNRGRKVYNRGEKINFRGKIFLTLAWTEQIYLNEMKKSEQLLKKR